ncbi:hypothetical protein ACG5V6_27740, partial [Streptomyces chitinivorans]
RARRIFGVERALLVSQGFHIRRALALCRAAGIDAHGVGVAEPPDATWYYGALRQVAGPAKAGLEAPSTPAPRSAGQPAPGRSPRDSAAALGGFARAARTAQRNTSTSGGSEPDGSEGNTEA